jgi:hypothetical protein
MISERARLQAGKLRLHLLGLLFPGVYAKRPRFVTLFRAFVDESGTSGPIMIVAACLTADKRYERFEPRWHDFIEKDMGDRPPALRAFHMLDYKKRQKQYEGWDDLKRKDHLRQADKLTHDHFPFAATTALILSDYKSVRRSRPWLPHPYAFATLRTMLLIKEWLGRTSPQGVASYVLEAGTAGFDQAINTLKRVMTHPEAKSFYRLVTFAPGTRLQWPGLQAADNVAFESRKHVERVVTNRMSGRERASLLSHSGWAIALYHEKELLRIVDRIKPEMEFLFGRGSCPYRSRNLAL